MEKDKFLSWLIEYEKSCPQYTLDIQELIKQIKNLRENSLRKPKGYELKMYVEMKILAKYFFDMRLNIARPEKQCPSFL